jgi:hypothetical protein
MLLHGDGTNGAQNNTFLDTSGNSYSITRNGNTTQGSFSPYGSNWSNSFNGSNSYLTLSSNASMSFGTGNFTIEGWFFTGDKSISGGASRSIIGNSGNSYTEQLYISTSGYLTFGNTGSTFIQGSTDLANNTWHYFAISRSGTSTNQIAMWVDGTRVAQGTNSQNYTSGTIYIGAFGTTDGFWNGYISNLRIVKGSAVYDPTNSTITVPTTPLTAITNTALLTCQTNRFFDASANAYTVTATDLPSVQRFNPFGTSTAYSTSVIGGSGYFDGTGDTLSLPGGTFTVTTGDYTIECWAYANSLDTSFYDKRIWCVGDSLGNDFELRIGASGSLYFSVNDGGQISASNYKTGTWYHFVLSRVSGTVRLFTNGVLTGSSSASSVSASLAPQFATTFMIGGASFDSSTHWNGYITGFKFTNGSGVTSVTVPTAPVTGGTLLLGMTNGAIFDNAMMNDLGTIADAKISTSVVKYGTGSLSFDGTGDRLFISDVTNLGFGTGDFTVELWVYFNVAPADTGFVGSVNNGGMDFVYHSSGSLRIGQLGVGWDSIFSPFTPATGTWYHIAFTRSGGTARGFVDGVQIGSNSTNTVSYAPSGGMNIGASNSTGARHLNGYIDDLRITKGYARYTANFTPPTAAFANIGPN